EETIDAEAPLVGETPPGKTPRVVVARESLAKKRFERIESLREMAQDAFDVGNFAAAVDLCEQAALLDPDNARVLTLLDRSRGQLDAQKVDALCASARAALEQGDMEEAARLLDDAREIDPRSENIRRIAAQRADVEARKRKEESQRRAIAASL